MNKLNKILATVPVLATTIMPMSVFAATGYQDTNEGVTYSNNIEADKAQNECEVLVTQTSSFSVVIPKTVILNGKVGKVNDADYNVTVKGNIASDETINVVPDSTFKMKDIKKVKDDIDANVTQSVTKFVNAETKEKVYANTADTIAIDVANETGKTTGTIQVENLTAGSWRGVFNFNINLSTKESA